MQRRQLLAAAIAVPLAAPRLATAQAGSKVLRFIPESDVTVLDPIWTTATVTHTHAYAVFDTLYGLDDSFAVQPQMVAGHTIENDGLLWRLTLRDGLRFHDGEPVRARDAVASLRRWAARDPFGRALMDSTDELSAPSDTVIQFRLRRKFGLLPNAISGSGALMPAIMPERLALTDPFKQVSEMVGSGPYRFNTAERAVGARVIYDRFDRYVPRPDGPPQYTAGPKQAVFDRIEWHVVPDATTCAGALIAGEVDWWEQPTPDLLPQLRSKGLKTEIQDVTGSISIMRFNHLQPPFDNPAIRRALLGAVDQSQFMTAMFGDDHSAWRDRVGVFSPGTPMASEAGVEVLAGPRDLPAVARALRDAGYNGERIVLLSASDQFSIYSNAQVAADLLKKVGMNVDLVVSDWGTLVQRRANKGPIDKGGWNIFFTNLGGTSDLDPASHLGIRGNGADAWYGWPTAPKLEALRQEWFVSESVADAQRICAELQRQFWQDVPYIPLGAYYGQIAYDRRLTGLRTGFSQFYNVRWS